MSGANHYINEALKPWGRKVTQDEYEIAVGRRCADCRKLIPEECQCPKN